MKKGFVLLIGLVALFFFLNMAVSCGDDDDDDSSIDDDDDDSADDDDDSEPWVPVEPHRETRGAYTVVWLAGTPYDMGYQQGELLMGELAAGVEWLNSMGLIDLLIPIARALGLVDLAMDNSYPDIVEECRGMVDAAVLSRAHWAQAPCTTAYPQPGAVWNGWSGNLCLPDAYDEAFLRDWHLPETVAAWTSWPPGLADLGAPARATALADLLGVQELARIFLHDLDVAPSDPALARLLAAYLTQVVLRRSRGRSTARMAALWNAWGEVLDRAGSDEGRVRLLARELYAEHGERLVASFSSTPASIVERVTAALVANPPRRA